MTTDKCFQYTIEKMENAFILWLENTNRTKILSLKQIFKFKVHILQSFTLLSQQVGSFSGIGPTASKDTFIFPSIV